MNKWKKEGVSQPPPPSYSLASLPTIGKGKTVGGYRLDRPIGNGERALVFLATKNNQEYVVKFPLVGKEYDNEVAILEHLAGTDAQLDVIPMVESGLSGLSQMTPLRGFVMPHAMPLAMPETPQQAWGLARRLVGALDRLHAANVAHNDLKQDNMLHIVEDAADHRPVFIDFGESILFGKEMEQDKRRVEKYQQDALLLLRVIYSLACVPFSQDPDYSAKCKGFNADMQDPKKRQLGLAAMKEHLFIREAPK